MGEAPAVLTPAARSAFMKVKTNLSSAALLVYPRADSLTCDSNIGTVLEQ